MSSECAREVEAAANANKRIVPVVLRAVPAEELPPPLTSVNWVDCQDAEMREAALDEVLEALDSDLAPAEARWP